MNQSPETKPCQPSFFRISPGVLLTVIILGAIALRLWGLDFGLPQAFHPDEPVVVTRAEYAAATNDWNPRAFQWPSLQIYILGIEYKIWYWTGGLLGSWDSEGPPGVPQSDRFAAYTLRAPSGFYYLGRLTTVIFGAGLVWLTFLLAKRFLRTPSALAAAALVAIHPILTRQGRYVTPDIPAEFFSIAALLFIDRVYQALSEPDRETQTETARRFPNPVLLAIYAAIMVGLATGTKYPAAVLAIPLLAVVLFAPSPFRASTRLFLGLRVCATIIIVFLLTTPYALLDRWQFLHDIQVIGWHVRTGHIGMEAPGGIWLASLRQFVTDSGWVWTIAGFVGLLCFFRKIGRTWPLALSLVFVLLGLAPLNVFSDRYLVPLIPFWAVGIAALLDLMVSDPGRLRIPYSIGLNVTGFLGWIEGLGHLLPIAGSIIAGLALSGLSYASGIIGMSRRSSAALSLALALSVLAIGSRGLYVLSVDAYRLTLPDTRELALEWVEKNIPAHSTIVEEQGGPDLHQVDPYDPKADEFTPLLPEPWYYVKEITPLFFRGGEIHDPLDTLMATLPDWVITSSRVRNRYMRPGAEKQYPDLVAVFREYYRLIDNYLIEEERFSPGNGVVGEEIVIYRVPEGLWERVRIDEGTVGEILGTEPE